MSSVDDLIDEELAQIELEREQRMIGGPLKAPVDSSSMAMGLGSSRPATPRFELTVAEQEMIEQEMVEQERKRRLSLQGGGAQIDSSFKSRRAGGAPGAALPAPGLEGKLVNATADEILALLEDTQAQRAPDSPPNYVRA